MIWVIAGTKDARKIIKLLSKKNYRVIATTTTEYGKNFIESNPNLKIASKAFQNQHFYCLHREKQISMSVLRQL